MHQPVCAICQKPTTSRFWVCADCEFEHDLEEEPFRNWPEWVKALVAHEQRKRRDELDCLKYEGFYPYDDELVSGGLLPSERGIQAAWDELAWMGVECADDLPADVF